MRFDIERVRREFPVLAQRVHGKPLVYLDSAATSQKPRAVIDAVSRFYAEDNANVHRGVHALAERATARLESARARVQKFVNAARSDEIVFVRGVTEAVNLVAHGFRHRMRAGDEILVTAMEHHSNLVPWQRLCQETGAHLRVVDVDDKGELRIEDLFRLLGPRTRLFAVAHVSNVLGTVNPVGRLVEIAHARGVPVLVDVASMVPPRENLFRYHRGGADLVIVSGGKGIRGPQSTGILAGRRDLIRAATLNASPNQAIGRPAKTSKEEIVGLVTALELFLAEDEKAETERYREVSQRIVDALQGIPGLRAVVEQDQVNRVLPCAVMYFEPSWTGPSGRAVQLALAAGDPHAASTKTLAVTMIVTARGGA